MTITVVNDRYVITASKGKLITDGSDVCAKKVILARNRAQSDFYEIDESEYTENGAD